MDDMVLVSLGRFLIDSVVSREKLLRDLDSLSKRIEALEAAKAQEPSP